MGLQWVAMGLALEIEPVPLRTDRDGVVRVGTTRVTLDSVVEAYLEGFGAEEIAEQYPALHLAEIYGVLSYFLRHRPSVEGYLAERTAQARATLAAPETPRATGLRQQLLARRAAEGSRRG